MRRDRKWLTHAAPPGFKFPERTKDRVWSEVKRCDDSSRLSVPIYRKVRGQDVWIKRTDAEIKAALSKAAGTAQLAYLRKFELPALAH